MNFHKPSFRGRVLLPVVLGLVASIVLVAPAQAASPAWRLVGAVGPTHLPPLQSEVQEVTVAAEGGTFTLGFASQTTVPLVFDATAAEVEDALSALSTIGGAGGSVSVSGGPGSADGGSPYSIAFGGSLANQDLGAVTANDSGLTSGAVIVKTLVPGGPGTGTIVVYLTNVGGAGSSGPATVTVGPLPAGIETSGSATGDGWDCLPAGSGQTTVTCTRTTSVAALHTAPTLLVPVAVGAGAPASSSVQLGVEGGGAGADPESGFDAPIVVSAQGASPGIQGLWAGSFDADGVPFTQAGGHPASAGTALLFNTVRESSGYITPAGDARNVDVDLPPGFVGNPLLTPLCPQYQLAPPYQFPQPEDLCTEDSVVGHNSALLAKFGQTATGGTFGDKGIYNDVPAAGSAAQFTFPVAIGRQSLFGSVRSDDDYGVTVTAPNVTIAYQVFGAITTLEGVPSGSGGQAFMTSPTDCLDEASNQPQVEVTANTWQATSSFYEGSVDVPPVTGCEAVPFEPSMTMEPTSSAPDSASGLETTLDLPQEGLTDPNAIATGHLKKAVVELPDGFSVNPSAATGLEGCSDAEIGLDDKAEPSCPDASKIGTVEVRSPLVAQPLTGELYLGTPKSTAPTSGEMLRLFLVARNARYGLLVKLPGATVADPVTGRLTATFDNSPRLPFDHLDVKLRGGSRGVLATSQTCNTEPDQYESVSSFTPWSQAHLPEGDKTPTVIEQSWTVDGDCSYGFNPGLKAGMSNAGAREGGTFGFEFTRPQGDQTLKGLTAELPTGLLATVKDLPLCKDAQAAAGNCPAASRIGLVDASAGSGDPFVLEKKGEIFLTEGYKGGPYGLMVKVRAIAGPFRGDMELSPIIVRQKIEVDPTTAQVKAISDPFPTIWHGVPLRVRRVLVNVDRPNFMINPSDCSSKEVKATLTSEEGTVAERSNPFQSSGCAALAFKPKLGLRLTGRKQVRTGKHPGIRAQVTQKGVSEAGIQRAEVRLPKSLALDVNNAGALCEFVDGTKPDLEKHCPKGSIVGRARATSPLLDRPLAGNVYFVKNVRVDPKTGNEIRTLPMVIAALRGEIAINLRGESSVDKRNRLVSTFATVPDAPVSKFNMNIRGGKRGIIAVTRTRRAKINICAGRQVAESDMDGHNGRRHDTNIRMKTPCTKKQTRKAKRAAKKAAKRARAARRG